MTHKQIIIGMIQALPFAIVIGLLMYIGTATLLIIGG
jgi:hypothetical protein